jgi:hypothetical protein
VKRRTVPQPTIPPPQSGRASASCRGLSARGASPGTRCHLQVLGSGDVGVARIEWKYLFVFLVAARPCCMVPFPDPHLLHVSHPW